MLIFRILTCECGSGFPYFLRMVQVLIGLEQPNSSTHMKAITLRWQDTRTMSFRILTCEYGSGFDRFRPGPSGSVLHQQAHCVGQAMERGVEEQWGGQDHLLTQPLTQVLVDVLVLEGQKVGAGLSWDSDCVRRDVLSEVRGF